MVSIGKRIEQLIALDMQLLSPLFDMEEANLSAYDYGLPSIQEANQIFGHHVQVQSQIFGASPRERPET